MLKRCIVLVSIVLLFACVPKTGLDKVTYTSLPPTQAALPTKTTEVTAPQFSTTTPRPTSTPWIPDTSTPTGTAVPTAMVEITPTMLPISRSWEAGPVIIEYGTYGENPAPFGVSRTPELILYSDGKLIVQSKGEFFESHLSQEEICTLLNTIEQVGFFDFDMSLYEEQLNKFPLGVVTTTVFEVNAWKQKQVAADELVGFIDNPDFQVPAPLEAVYFLLSSFHTSDLNQYQYSHLAFTIYQYPPEKKNEADEEWPLKSPSLEELYEKAERERVINRKMGFGLLLEGSTATDVYLTLRQNNSSAYEENDETYIVFARPLLPYESLESAVTYDAVIPSPGIVSNTVELTCRYANGVTDIP